MEIIKKTRIAAVFVLAFMMIFASFAPMAKAESVVSYPNPHISSMQDYINYLYQLVAQLERQKELLEQRQYGYYNQYHVNYYGPYGRVLGTNYNNNYNYNYSYQTGDIDVETIAVGNTDDDSTTLYGRVDLNGASYADVWFEYGENYDLDEETREVRVTSRHSSQFSARLTNLDEDERYAYRAVAEGPDGHREYGKTKYFQLDGYDGGSSRRDDDEPDVRTQDAEDVDEDSAEMHGRVDMNDFDDGYVFFVYGEDEDQVEDVEDEDEYSDIEEDGDDLQKVVADRNLDGTRSYWYRITGLNDDTDYYFRICVEYEDEDDDETLECGDVEHFETDRD